MEYAPGSDTAEGSALASGILETFIEMNVFFLATTHQSTLKTYALSCTGIENAHLNLMKSISDLTYRFQVGIPGNSLHFIYLKTWDCKILHYAEQGNM
jgi:DNA mismatch repair protein MutS2